MFTADGKPSEDDPRENGPRLADERTTLVEVLRCARLTLEMKCAGLDAEAMAQAQSGRWLPFPEACRSHHPWRPGTVTISWEPCDCEAARAARGGHLKVACNAPGCHELWWAPLHRPTRLPRILGHHRPGYR